VVLAAELRDLFSLDVDSNHLLPRAAAVNAAIVAPARRT
jgi:hypothetical protein